MNLNPTPFSQYFKLIRWCGIVKTKLTLVDKKMKVFLVNAIVFSKYSFGLRPEVFNSVNVVMVLCKLF